MPNMVNVRLEAKGQALAITQAPPVLASGIAGLMRFEVFLSDEWAGFENYAVLLRRGGVVRSCEIVWGASIDDASSVFGEAIADAEALAGAGALEVAVVAYGEGLRLTTERAIMALRDSGL